MTQDKNLHGIEPDPETRDADADPSQEGMSGAIENMMREVLGDGWGGVKDDAAALRKQRMDNQAGMKREANIFRDTFATEVGQKCLAIMREMTIEAAPYPVEAMLPMDAITPLVIAHTAQVQFVRAVENAIAFANNQEAKARTDA